MSIWWRNSDVTAETVITQIIRRLYILWLSENFIFPEKKTCFESFIHSYCIVPQTEGHWGFTTTTSRLFVRMFVFMCFSYPRYFCVYSKLGQKKRQKFFYSFCVRNPLLSLYLVGFRPHKAHTVMVYSCVCVCVLFREV